MGAGHRLLRDFFAAFPAGLHESLSYRMDTFQGFHDRLLINASVPSCGQNAPDKLAQVGCRPVFSLSDAAVSARGAKRDTHPPSLLIALSELLQPREPEARGSPGSKTGYSPLLKDLPSVPDVRSGCPLHNSRHFSAQGREVAPRVPEGTTSRTASTAA